MLMRLSKWLTTAVLSDLSDEKLRIPTPINDKIVEIIKKEETRALKFCGSTPVLVDKVIKTGVEPFFSFHFSQLLSQLKLFENVKKSLTNLVP